MNKLIGWILLIISILLLLPLFGLDIGKASSWIIAIGVFLISIIWLADR
ncbi:MAG TPA: hypothetical protein VJH92_04655 [Candidatus Nanoarchaeia archaeon]|nr:hypothetical protein [Candidatus Nanoarchaeia archaeon]